MYSSKPKWWILYATVPLMLIGLFLVLSTGWSNLAKTTISVVIITCTFGGMALWMGANEGTILRAEIDQERRAQAKRQRLLRARGSRPVSAPAPTLAAYRLRGLGLHVFEDRARTSWRRRAAVVYGFSSALTCHNARHFE